MTFVEYLPVEEYAIKVLGLSFYIQISCNDPYKLSITRCGVAWRGVAWRGVAWRVRKVKIQS